MDDLRAERKEVASSIPRLEGEDKAAAIAQGRALRERITELEETQRQTESPLTS